MHSYLDRTLGAAVAAMAVFGSACRGARSATDDESEAGAADATTTGDDGAGDDTSAPPSTPYCDEYDASALSGSAVAAGFQLVWKVYRCWTCHQTSLQLVDDAGGGIVLAGNGEGIGDSGTIFPPNLTPEPVTGIGCWSDSELRAAMLDGGRRGGGELCPSMPRYGEVLAAADGGVQEGTPMDAGTVGEVIAFLRRLTPELHELPDTTCADAGGQ